jgi:tripartite-type tricarboxylate transporter receptor subunit TctC
MDVNTFSTTVPYAKQNQVRVLALSSDKRTPLMPDVPTIAESGVQGFSAESWLAMVAPPGLPADMADSLQRAIATIVALPEVKAKLASLGSDPVGGTPKQLSERMQRDSATWKQVVQTSGISIN